MSQITDAEIIEQADVIAAETVAGANTKTRVATILKDIADSKVNNDKIDTDAGLATASKTLAGRDAVKAYIAQQIANLVASSPATLDTLNEIAAALGDDPNFSTTILNMIADLQTQIDDLVTPTPGTITGGQTLDATAFGKTFYVSGTTADYTVVLPTAVGNAENSMTFIFLHGLTKLVTLDGNGSETIAGSLLRSFWANESVTLMSDGTNWVVPMYKAKAMSGHLLVAAQSIPNLTLTRFIFTSAANNAPATFASVADNRINILRAGNYKVELYLLPAASAQTTPALNLFTYLNGGSANPGLALGGVPAANQTVEITKTYTPQAFAAGDQVDLRVQVSTTGGAARSCNAILTIIEII